MKPQPHRRKLEDRTLAELQTLHCETEAELEQQWLSQSWRASPEARRAFERLQKVHDEAREELHHRELERGAKR